MSDADRTQSSVTARTLVCAAVMFMSVSVAEAQTDLTRWGAGAGIVPVWSIPTGSGPLAKLAEFVHESGDFGVDVDGIDFRVGVVRGRTLAGEWGVSFVRRSMKDGSTQGGFQVDCFESSAFGQSTTQCFTGGTRYVYQDVKLNGVEVNKFIPVVTVKRRLQIGIDLAGGVGSMTGTAEQQSPENTFVPVRNPQGQIIGQTVVTTINSTIVDAKELVGIDPMLIGRVEFAVAGILGPSLKVRFSAGMNFPGSHTASVSASYFFGRD